MKFLNFFLLNNMKILLGNSIKLNFFKYTPAFGWGVFVLIMSLLPSSKIPSALISLQDIYIHFSIYFVLAALIIWPYEHSRQASTSRSFYLYLFFLSSLYGWFIEFLQGTFSEKRQFEVSDGISNTLGVLVAIFLFSAYFKFKKSRK